MNFEDEPYVRLYTRDTKTWLKLGFEGQTVLMHLMRKLDRAGVLDDVTDPVEDVALVIQAPLDFVRVGLQRLLKSGTLEIRGARLVVPRYVEGQTATKTDRLRSAELRKRRRDLARAGHDEPLIDDEVGPVESDSGCDTETQPSVMRASPSVTPESPLVTEPSRAVTSGHAASRAVTPSLALPSLALLNGSPLTPTDESVSTSSTRAGKKPKAPRARSQCPLDLQPDATTNAKAWELGFTKSQLAAELEDFIDWWRGKGLLQADWQATLRHRLRAQATKLALKPRKPRDARLDAYQAQLRKANEPIKDAVAPPPGFNEAVGNLFA
jgi:hypothetical protein